VPVSRELLTIPRNTHRRNDNPGARGAAGISVSGTTMSGALNSGRAARREPS
jgi:hypothetical protein